MKIAFGIIALLVLSTFAIALALADESVTVEDSIATETTDTVTDAVPTTTATETTEIADVSQEVEAIAPSVQAAQPQQRYLGIARVTVGDGFAISSDNTKGERISGFWVSGRYISIDPSVVKNLTKQYKGQPAKLREELAKLATDKVVVKATGRLSIGVGRAKEKFKLLKKEFTNTSVTFYVLPINTNIAELKDATDDDINAKAVGTLKLDATVYPHLTLWKGTLTLNSGAYTGTWSVTASSLSKVITNQNIKKVRAAVITAVQNGTQAAGVGPKINKTAAAQIVQKRPNWIAKLMFWRKAANAQGTE